MQEDLMSLWPYGTSSMVTCGVRIMFSAINRLLDATPSDGNNLLARLNS